MGKAIPGQVGSPAQYRNPRNLVGVWKVLWTIKMMLSMVSYLEEWELLGTELLTICVGQHEIVTVFKLKISRLIYLLNEILR